MKVAIRYFTKMGSTKKLAEARGEVAEVPALDITNKLDKNVDVLFLGSSSHGIKMSSEVQKFIDNIDVKVGKVVYFSSMKILGHNFKQIKDALGKKNINMDSREYHLKGLVSLLGKKRPNREDIENVKEFAKEIIGK